MALSTVAPELLNPPEMGRGIIKDPVPQSIYFGMNYATACEDCTHFDADSKICTLGFLTEPHLKSSQLRDLNEHGKIAFCRAMEID